MEIIRTVEWMKQAARAAESSGRIIGLVPTMGALHEGHLSLVRAAKQQCAPVVVSIFVNPKQFSPGEDFSNYPRTFETDRALLEGLSVDYLFFPEPEEIYPKDFRSAAHVHRLTARWEGAVRPGHFDGVTTVVLKLFEIVRPRFAYFGRKDAQQARIVRQLVKDLTLDAEIVVCPIVREPDGLAMSSRNAYLSEAERKAATVLYRSLSAVQREIESGTRAATSLVATLHATISREPLAKLDYGVIVDADSLEPVDFLRGECLVLLAARIGATRLLDNMLVAETGGKLHTSL